MILRSHLRAKSSAEDNHESSASSQDKRFKSSRGHGLQCPKDSQAKPHFNLLTRISMQCCCWQPYRAERLFGFTYLERWKYRYKLWN
jgi:hypothetical protein